MFLHCIKRLSGASPEASEPSTDVADEIVITSADRSTGTTLRGMNTPASQGTAARNYELMAVQSTKSDQFVALYHRVEGIFCIFFEKLYFCQNKGGGAKVSQYPVEFLRFAN